MTLSPQLEQLRQQIPDYEASELTRQRIAHKTLLGLIGPSAVGKSTLAQRIVELGGDDYSEAYSVVTRQRRADDPPEYRTATEGYTIDRVTDLVKKQLVTNYSIHPSGNIYATISEGFPADYNLLPLMPSSLPMMQKAGFAAVHAIYIVTSAEQWAVQLQKRQADPSYRSRILEAVTSLDWGIEHADELHFIENTSDLDHAAEQIMALAEGKIIETNRHDGLILAGDMLEFAATEQRRIS